jgi:hypothetical protein
MLIDTCVWLDLIKDSNSSEVLTILEELAKTGQISFIVPETILLEFSRNKSKVIKEAGISISGGIKKVKDIVDKFGDPKEKKAILDQLNDIGHKVHHIGES